MYYFNIYLGGLRKHTENLSQDSLCPSQNSDMPSS
jgi:hypothetical protein